MGNLDEETVPEETLRPGTRREGMPPYIGPLTENVMNMSTEGGGVPALIGEWHGAVREPGDFILFWGGAERGATETDTRSWAWMNTAIADPADPGEQNEEPSGPPAGLGLAAKVERMLSPMAHESRVRIMQVLLEAARGASDLSEATGLRGGNLYHHLKELTHSGYVGERDGRYVLTILGRQLIITMTCLADRMVQDREQEGLVVDVR